MARFLISFPQNLNPTSFQQDWNVNFFLSAKELKCKLKYFSIGKKNPSPLSLISMYPLSGLKCKLYSYSLQLTWSNRIGLPEKETAHFFNHPYLLCLYILNNYFLKKRKYNLVICFFGIILTCRGMKNASWIMSSRWGSQHLAFIIFFYFSIAKWRIKIKQKGKCRIELDSDPLGL